METMTLKRKSILNLDDLQVDSFDALPDISLGGGTVYGMDCTDAEPTTCTSCSCEYTCAAGCGS